MGTWIVDPPADHPIFVLWPNRRLLVADQAGIRIHLARDTVTNTQPLKQAVCGTRLRTSGLIDSRRDREHIAHTRYAHHLKQCHRCEDKDTIMSAPDDGLVTYTRYEYERRIEQLAKDIEELARRVRRKGAATKTVHSPTAPDYMASALEVLKEMDWAVANMNTYKIVQAAREAENAEQEAAARA